MASVGRSSRLTNFSRARSQPSHVGAFSFFSTWTASWVRQDGGIPQREGSHRSWSQHVNERRPDNDDDKHDDTHKPQRHALARLALFRGFLGRGRHCTRDVAVEARSGLSASCACVSSGDGHCCVGLRSGSGTSGASSFLIVRSQMCLGRGCIPSKRLRSGRCVVVGGLETYIMASFVQYSVASPSITRNTSLHSICIAAHISAADCFGRGANAIQRVTEEEKNKKGVALNCWVCGPLLGYVRARGRTVHPRGRPATRTSRGEAL